MAKETIVALDIETTGLDPQSSRVLAVALSSRGADNVLTDDGEARLLENLERTIAGLPADATLVTWNGEGFDLPFLAERYEFHGVPTSLQLRPRNVIGKYGRPRFEATWGGRPHVDIAYAYRSRAESLGVEWSLKPLARALGHDPVEVDRNGKAIENMPLRLLKAYAASDARVTATLAEEVV